MILKKINLKEGLWFPKVEDSIYKPYKMFSDRLFLFRRKWKSVFLVLFFIKIKRREVWRITSLYKNLRLKKENKKMMETKKTKRIKKKYLIKCFFSIFMY